MSGVAHTVHFKRWHSTVTIGLFSMKTKKKNISISNHSRFDWVRYISKVVPCHIYAIDFMRFHNFDHQLKTIKMFWRKWCSDWKSVGVFVALQRFPGLWKRSIYLRQISKLSTQQSGWELVLGTFWIYPEANISTKVEFHVNCQMTLWCVSHGAKLVAILSIQTAVLTGSSEV